MTNAAARDLEAALTSLVGLEVEMAGQRIFGLTLELGPSHLYVASDDDARAISSALTELGLSARVSDGDLSLTTEAHLTSRQGLWALTGPGVLETGYEYTLTGAGEDPAVVAATQEALDGLLGREVTGASLELDGTLTLVIAPFTVKVWPDEDLHASDEQDGDPRFPVQDWCLGVGDDAWTGLRGRIERTGYYDGEVPTVSVAPMAFTT